MWLEATEKKIYLIYCRNLLVIPGIQIDFWFDCRQFRFFLHKTKSDSNFSIIFVNIFSDIFHVPFSFQNMLEDDKKNVKREIYSL